MDAADRFHVAVRDGALHTLDPVRFQPTPGAAAADDYADALIKVYTDKMAGQNAPGRPIYDELRLSAPRCPLCGHRDTTTLDHHLPKTKFPLLSVAPDNLVPACSECNKVKTDALPASAETQTLHPYFDHINDIQWLTAEVVELTPPAIRFSVTPPPTWSSLLAGRVRHHFDTFGLASLYAAQAGDEMSGIAFYLQIQYDAAGPSAVRTHLEDMAASRRRARLNSWNAAAYSALATSNWYCSGGFTLR